MDKGNEGFIPEGFLLPRQKRELIIVCSDKRATSVMKSQRLVFGKDCKRVDVGSQA